MVVLNLVDLVKFGSSWFFWCVFLTRDSSFLLVASWPVDRATEVAKFLLESSQHCHLQVGVQTHVDVCKHVCMKECVLEY